VKEQPPYQPDQNQPSREESSLSLPDRESLQKEINKHLSRARRLNYRKERQTLPERIGPAPDPLLHEAEKIVFTKEYKQMVEAREQELSELLTPEERELYEVLLQIEDLSKARIMTKRITSAQDIEHEMLDKMQRFDPAFMDPIIEGVRKRPARQAKAQRAIQRRSISPGVDHYVPLWER
jgi:hypothetical protein